MTTKIENFVLNFFSDKNEKKVMKVKWIIVVVLLAIIIVANILR
jgi:hypothetical protein